MGDLLMLKPICTCFMILVSAYQLQAENQFSTQQQKEHKLYTAQNSSEAIMKFSHWVEMQSMRPPTPEIAREQIERQLTHLFGPMGAQIQSAVPRGDHKLRVYKPKKVSESTYRIAYSYVGTIVLKNGPQSFYDILLPSNPDEIYQRGLVGSKNLCTDDHYQSEGDFWYFWNPYQRGCPLKEGYDFFKIRTNIERKTNQRISFPEYSRLVQKDSSGNELISIRVFLGMDKPSHGKNPFNSKDLNAETFLTLHKYFTSKNFAPQNVTLNQHPGLQKLKKSPVGHLETYEKVISKGRSKLRLSIEMYFGPTGINEDSSTFHHLFKNAIEAASVLIYDGHSGLGGHLDIESIESLERFQVHFDPLQYQIFYFNSCSSYPYYNTMYFERKKSEVDPVGSQNLDILTNGLATYFSVLDRSSLALITAIEYWAANKAVISYQELAREIDSGNLFGINGDEDNPKSP